MAYADNFIKKLEGIAKTLRRDSITMMKKVGQGWPGGSFSEAEIVTALMFHRIKHNPQNPQWPNRDRLIISKGHSCEMLYAALGEAGYFDKKEYLSYGQFGAMLQAHVDRKVLGVEYSGGSLGQGLSFAIGQALAARINEVENKTAPYRVFCIIGDGESDEGQIWEAAMAAAHYKVDNLTAIVDRNKFQSTASVVDRMNLEPLVDKWKAFGWEVTEINGHDFTEILNALEWVDTIPNKPQVIIAHTVKGKGLPSYENTNQLHHCKITDEMYAEGMKNLK